jgi:hypothetical protein
MLYMVECRFNDPAREDGWNEWYSGKRLGELLAVPGFLASQRLLALTRPGRYYLALHSIGSLEVFQRPEYKAMGGGGFQGYQGCITDWVRRFFTGMDMAPAIASGERLVVADAGEASVVGSGLDFTWVRPVGDDDRGGPRGLAVVDAATGARLVAEGRHPLDVYEPMVPRRSGTAAQV